MCETTKNTPQVLLQLHLNGVPEGGPAAVGKGVRAARADEGAWRGAKRAVLQHRHAGLPRRLGASGGGVADERDG